MISHILLLILGLVLIIGGGNYVTNGAVAVANKIHMSPLLIGLTVVAFGSSTPDLVVSMISTIHGKSAMAVGNVVGAVIFDILLVIGVMAVMRPIRISKSTFRIDLPVMILGTLILLGCAETSIFDHHAVDGISRIEGVMLLVFFILFMWYTIHNSKAETEACQAEHTGAACARHKTAAVKSMPMWLASVCIVGGLAALVFGGQWTVNSASYIAEKAGLSEALIGLTIVGIGSSLPDLATSVIAAIKGENALALGNIIGSCIIDVMFVIGSCAVVRPLHTAGIASVDFITLAVGALLVFLMCLFSKDRIIGRREGVALILLYIVYMAYLIFSHN